jgi:colanic acid biosynthesis glycosyl transferase WcaI
MRILIYSEAFWPELISTGKYTGEMAQWIAARGHEVRVVTTPPHFPQWRVFNGYSSYLFKRERWPSPSGSTGAVEVIRCPAWIPREPRGWKRVLYLASFALSSFPAALSQISWRPDAVLLIEPTLACSLTALCLARWAGATAWLHVQDFEVDVAFQLGDFSSPRLKQWVYTLERFVMQKFDRVSAISPRMVERLPAKGVEPERTVFFPNWVDTSAIYPMRTPSPLRQELGIGKQSIVALFSGSMGMKHGLKLLVDASRQLAFRPDIQFVFCGDGPYRETLARLVGESGNVIFLPVQPAERLNELLNLADIHLLPQMGDAADLVMPSKLTGMMASGRAVVATAHPETQIYDVLKERGIVTPPGDVGAFVSAVIRLADDPSLRLRMGEEARRYAVAHMDRDEILRRFELSLMETRGYSSICPEEGLSTNQDGKLPVL